MSLAVLFDDRLEPLADALIAWFAAAPRTPDPLAQDTVVVPDTGTGRWLAQRIAARHGVCARVRFELPGRFFWRTLRELIPQLPALSPFEPDNARWAILQLFQDLDGVADCEALARRVAGAQTADRLALAGDIAAQFERYLVLRRDWLERWQRGAWAQGSAPISVHERWQRWLWRRLLERLPDVSRTHPYDRLDQALSSRSEHAAALATQRVAVFGATAMSQEQMQVLARLAERMEVAAFVADPCRELWSDLVDPKSLARVRSERPDLAWLYQDEPQVLGLWGRAHRDRVAQWLMLDELESVQSEAPFRDRAHPLDALCAARASELTALAASLPHDLTRLGALHAAIHLRSDRPWALVRGSQPDASIVLHATHGALRAAEVLHDQLLECFASMPGLRPDQVLVLCCDLDASADAIEAVFASAPPARRIPIGVSGRRARVDPMQRAVLEFLEFALAGAQLSALEQWLANPAVLDALSLDAQGATALVAACEQAGVRWGLDHAGGPPKHNWRAGIDRLVLGAALGGAVARIEDVAPLGGLRRVGDEVFERLLEVLHAAHALRAAAQAPRPVAQWCALVRDALNAVFDRALRHADSLARVLSALGELEQSASSEPDCTVDAKAFRQALADELDRGASAALASGAVTVCPIGGLRGIAFRVVVLFGLDESVFPRAGARGEFDLIARAPRFGDRASGVDDRGVFLDAVLAAQERFVVFYAGRDPRDDTPRNPSTVVTELVEYVNARQPPGIAALAPEFHPLHPFSPRAFFAPPGSSSGARPSYARQWEATARALRAPIDARREQAGALTDPTAAVPQARPAEHAWSAPAFEADEIAALRDALADPAKAHLRAVHGLSLPREAGAASDVEPMGAGSSDDRALVDATAQRLLQGAAQDALHAELRALPQIAAGSAGEVQACAVLSSATQLVQRARALAPGGVAHAPITVSAFNLGMYALIGAWLGHAAWMLARAAGSPPGANAESYLVTPDATVTIRIADPAAALAHARACVARIATTALPLFPKTAREIVAGSHREKVLATLLGDEAGWAAGEIHKPWFAALYRDSEPALEQVARAAHEVYAMILADCAVAKAGT